jgi:hypothetical protein
VDCSGFVLNSYYVVPNLWGRALGLAVFGVMCWHLYGFFRPARLARRFGWLELDPSALALARSLVARNVALALAVVLLMNSTNIKPLFAVLCIACVASLVDAIAIARARGIGRSLDLWALSALLGLWAFQLYITADELCRAMIDGL